MRKRKINVSEETKAVIEKAAKDLADAIVEETCKPDKNSFTWTNPNAPDLSELLAKKFVERFWGEDV